MDFSYNYIKNYLSALGFVLADGEQSVWFKNFSQYNDFIIKISIDNENLSDSKITYGDFIKIGRKTTSNFNQPENLVVLECVNRLLEKGYRPEDIELEKGWRVGGYLDIFVKDLSGNCYIMIECKQWGREYNDALKIILQNNQKKEQIFNYYIQDKNAKYCALYCSKLIDGNIQYKNDIISMEQFRECNNHNEIYNKWDKTFQSKGIFENYITIYNIRFLGIVKGDLKPLDQVDVDYKEESEATIYNRFAEILRRHTISDKTNAYNKIFNLFLCKIVDEDSAVSEDQEMQFQWKESEEPELVLGRLNDLYKIGMKEYLKLDVADVSENELEIELNRIFGTIRPEVQKIKAMFRKVRLYKNNEFAFKEVIDERTFLENAQVVKEVIKLLEPYQIKYSHKQQFMGDFFERLLNIGIKQEAGQFFTPVPITSFVCKSIPFEDIIYNKINNRDPSFLPHIIDYACGSGHFLTEAMERVENILQKIGEQELKTRPQKDNLYGWKRSFKWAREFIYGIERDYRLAKTTKLACFLYGDGEANIFYADGLDKFNSLIYSDKLHSESTSKDNPVFDVVIANPPYSVDDFKYIIKDGGNSFDLFQYVRDRSDDIECLFVERTKQLLKEEGYAGILVPSSMLLNRGIHQKSRELLLKNFEIIGICGLGKNTFAATGQNTVVLFLRKRKALILGQAESFVNEYLAGFRDISFNGHENIFSIYKSLFHSDISLNDYKEKLTEEKFINTERRKLLLFLLNYDQNVVIAKSGEKEDEKRFLGYEHSDMKKYEGIHSYPYNPDGRIHSMLYDENVLDNPDRVSTYIYKNYRREPISEINGKLNKHLKIMKLHEIIDLDAENFENKIYADYLENPFLANSVYPLTSLNDETIAEILDSQRVPIRESKRTQGNIPYYGANGEIDKISEFIFNEKLVLIAEDGGKWGKFENTAYIIEGKSWVNNHAHIIKPKTEKLLHEYLIYIFNYLDLGYLKSRPNGGKLLQSDMKRVKRRRRTPLQADGASKAPPHESGTR